MRQAEYSIVQIAATFYRKGQGTWDYRDNKSLDSKHDIWTADPSFTAALAPYVFNDSDGKPYDYFQFDDDVVGLDFTPVGTGHGDNQPSGIGFDAEMCGWNDFFGKYGKEWMPLLESARRPNLETVRILTVWAYRSWRDCDGEWDSESDYLGILDLNTIGKAMENRPVTTEQGGSK